MDNYFEQHITNELPAPLPAVIPNHKYYMGCDPGDKYRNAAIVVCYVENIWDQPIFVYCKNVPKTDYQKKVQEIAEHFNPVSIYAEQE